MRAPISPPAPVAPEQLRLALVYGKAFTELPQDLYIPPDALEVFLEAFEGPLDLLLYLIRRQNVDILDIPVAEITRQYMGYVELMKNVHLELAAEYLVMAAMLAEIKSRMLLPRSAEAEEDEDDPRAELIRRLQEYEHLQAGRRGPRRVAAAGPRRACADPAGARGAGAQAAARGRPGRGAAGDGRGAAPRRHVRKPPGDPRGAVHPRAHERGAGAAARAAPSCPSWHCSASPKGASAWW